MFLGAHMSTSGGFYRAVERAAEAGCDCVQIFTTSPRQWPKLQDRDAAVGRSGQRTSAGERISFGRRSIDPQEVARFQTALEENGIRFPTSHASYLINLASPDPLLWKKSVDAFVLELRRADQLGIAGVVLHPGAHMGAGEEAGIRRIVRALNEVHRRTRRIASRCLLENTAGQGSSLGWRFEHLAAVLQRVRAPERLGVCLDTCHLLAAGYPLSTSREYAATMRQFHRIVGIRRIGAMHLNDSKRELGSRVDRHAHIGQGELGDSAFANVLNDRRLRNVPMFLETPKGHVGGDDCDALNLCKLRSLISD